MCVTISITALVSMTPLPLLLQFNKEVVTRDQGLRAQTLFVVFKPIGYERTDVPLVSIFWRVVAYMCDGPIRVEQILKGPNRRSRN